VAFPIVLKKENKNGRETRKMRKTKNAYRKSERQTGKDKKIGEKR